MRQNGCSRSGVFGGNTRCKLFLKLDEDGRVSDNSGDYFYSGGRCPIMLGIRGTIGIGHAVPKTFLLRSGIDCQELPFAEFSSSQFERVVFNLYIRRLVTNLPSSPYHYGHCRGKYSLTFSHLVVTSITFFIAPSPTSFCIIFKFLTATPPIRSSVIRCK